METRNPLHYHLPVFLVNSRHLLMLLHAFDAVCSLQRPCMKPAWDFSCPTFAADGQIIRGWYCAAEMWWLVVGW